MEDTLPLRGKRAIKQSTQAVKEKQQAKNASERASKPNITEWTGRLREKGRQQDEARRATAVQLQSQQYKASGLTKREALPMQELESLKRSELSRRKDLQWLR